MHTSVGHNSSSYCPLQTSPVIPNFISKQFTALHARTRRDIFVDKGKQDLASLADSDNPASVVFAKQMCDLVDSKADSGTTVTATTDLPVTFQRVGIHPSFTQAYPDRIALQHVRDYQLPHVPLCPGPYLLDDSVLLQRPQPSAILSTLFPREASIYKEVLAKGCPNYRGAQVPVSALPLKTWEEKLKDFEDTQLVSFMKYGWPTGFEGSEPPDLLQDNHGSARRRPEHVAGYVDTEIRMGALGGPFRQLPFTWLRLNPMLTREKKEPGRFRVILDLSFPWGDSVNYHIDKHLL